MSYTLQALGNVLSIASFLAFLWGTVLVLENFRKRKTDAMARQQVRRGLIWMLASITSTACFKALDMLN